MKPEPKNKTYNPRNHHIPKGVLDLSEESVRQMHSDARKGWWYDRHGESFFIEDDIGGYHAKEIIELLDKKGYQAPKEILNVFLQNYEPMSETMTWEYLVQSPILVLLERKIEYMVTNDHFINASNPKFEINVRWVKHELNYMLEIVAYNVLHQIFTFRTKIDGQKWGNDLFEIEIPTSSHFVLIDEIRQEFYNELEKNHVPF